MRCAEYQMRELFGKDFFTAQSPEAIKMKRQYHSSAGGMASLLRVSLVNPGCRLRGASLYQLRQFFAKGNFHTQESR